MKSLLIVIMFIVVNISYALPCPNGSQIIYRGESMNHVLQQCGEPTSRQVHLKGMTGKQQWTYFKPTPVNQAHSKIIISFENQYVSNINIINTSDGQVCADENKTDDYIQMGGTICSNTQLNVRAAQLCGTIIRAGQSANEVRARCGNPIAISGNQTSLGEVVELIYAGTPTRTLIFDNGQFVNWN